MGGSSATLRRRTEQGTGTRVEAQGDGHRGEQVEALRAQRQGPVLAPQQVRGERQPDAVRQGAERGEQGRSSGELQGGARGNRAEGVRELEQQEMGAEGELGCVRHGRACQRAPAGEHAQEASAQGS